MIAWLLACIAAAPPGDCSALSTDTERDRCRYEQLMALPADQVDAAATLAPTIEDPIMQGAAVVGWVQKHARSLSPEGGERLCGILQKDSERTACARRFSAAHLQR